jgi:hypothetical protein
LFDNENQEIQKIEVMRAIKPKTGRIRKPKLRRIRKQERREENQGAGIMGVREQRSVALEYNRTIS